MASDRILISGLGLVTPLGNSAWGTFRALLSGKTLASRSDRLPPDVAPVDLVRALGSVSIARHVSADPAVELAERAAREALDQAGGAGDAVMVFGMSKGAMHGLSRLAGGPKGPFGAPAEQETVLFPHAHVADQLSRRLGLPVASCVVAACASSLTALHQARRMLLCGEASRVLVVTAEAALLPVFIHSYRRLGVLPPLTVEGYVARPLDESRDGFMLAEQAAAVVLELAGASARTDEPGKAIELLDTAVACEGFDLVRSAPGMPALRHVAAKLLAGRTIDVLHPHATGTRDHDPAELAVYHAALAASRSTAPALYANKGALGHGLGAAGLTSLVLACLCARTNRVPPMPWLRSPIPACSFFTSDIKHQTSDMLRTHAVFAAGFGGHVAGAVIRLTSD